MAFPSIEMTGISTSIAISLTSTVQLNVFIPCALPPISRRFKAWSSQSPKSVTFTSLQCAQFQAPCDLLASTECTRWNPAIQQGWYTDNLGACLPCSNQSTYSTCTWGQYRDLTQCTTSLDTPCTACVGVLPGNATWTVSIAPHYYSSSITPPCAWDCIQGFYRLNNQCVPCSKPSYSNFLDGPMINALATPPAKTCLDATTCKYFGGSELFGCTWKCAYGYFQVTPLTAGSAPYCTVCVAVTCLPGTVSSTDPSTGCQLCQACPSIVANANYGASCSFTCNAGYFKNSTNLCQACSTISYPVSQWTGISPCSWDCFVSYVKTQIQRIQDIKPCLCWTLYGCHHKGCYHIYASNIISSINNNNFYGCNHNHFAG